ncbi:hypothetical protein QQX98_005222 [Neonectria punicea]|uniref:U3 snoRNA associated n=1 Tax=Neonectria punicea TaxID=979145 RepID=A0ABR1H5P8_9HYPO
MTPAKTRKRKSGEDLPGEAAIDVSRNLPVRAKDGEAPDATMPSSAPAQGNMKVFTDEDMAAPVVLSKPAAPAIEEDEDDKDSDDEAPEAVSTTKVASDIKKSAQAAQKAAQEQAAVQKRKRQEKDKIFKQQAEERKKAEEGTNAAEEPTAVTSAPVESLTRKRRGDKIQVPNLLPAEFLTDSSSDDEAEDDRLRTAVRSKKRKITTIERSLARESRGPRDARVGSTVYRVAKKVDDRMAPKLAKHTKNSKDLLLKRNRTAVKPQRSGFLVKK